MADERLRLLERRWRETGAKDDEIAYLREGVRAGQCIETGYIQRLKGTDWGPKYRPVVRIYLPEGSQDVSLRPRLGSGILDVEYSDEQIHVVKRNANVFSIYRIDTVGKIMHTVSSGSLIGPVYEAHAIQNVEGNTLFTTTSEVYEAHAIQNVEGVLSCIRTSGSSWSLTRVDTPSPMHYPGAIVDWTPRNGMIHLDNNGNVVYGPELCSQLVYNAVTGVKNDVYIENQNITTVPQYVSKKRNAEQGITRISGLQIPAESRFAKRCFAVRTTDDLARNHALFRGMAHGCEFRRVLLEVPRKNIEGLLAAVEQAQSAESED